MKVKYEMISTMWFTAFCWIATYKYIFFNVT